MIDVVGVAAMSPDGIMGDGEKLLWDCPADMARVKYLSADRGIIMGRKTYDSLPVKTFNDTRFLYVISRTMKEAPENVHICRDPHQALLAALTNCEHHPKKIPEVVVWGGAGVFHKLWDSLDRLELSVIDVDIEHDENMVYFPEVSLSEWRLRQCATQPAVEPYPASHFLSFTRA